MRPDRLAAEIAANGFVIAERHLDHATFEETRRVHAEYVAAADSRNARTSSSGGDRRVHLNPDFAGLQQLHRDPVLRAVATLVMKTPIALGYFLSRSVHPGASSQALHMDCDPGAPTLLGFIYALDDFTAENGCTRFVPGSHRDASASTEMLATVPAGSLIMYDRSVLHGYTVNASKADRRSIQGGFDPA